MKRREDFLRSIGRKLLLLSPDGEETPVDPNGGVQSAVETIQDPALRSYVLSEELKAAHGKTPPSIQEMRRLELVDYEPASDSGHFRFYPKGSIVYDLLVAWADEIALRRIEALKIETPLLYDWSQPDIRQQGESFHERHYTVSAPGRPGREWVLRFAGDFGLFRMIRDARLSYRHLPLRIYELSRSFRCERSGELSGLKRLRAFTMPDIHSFCRDVEEAWEEYGMLYRHYHDLAEATGVDFAVVFRVVEAFYREHRRRILRMLRQSGKPALVELLSGMKHYWVVKHEFQGIDSVGGCCQLSTVQLDVVDSDRYGITFTGADGKKRGCAICHSSVGSIERWIYVILEKALQRETPVMPTWLSPIQLRILPVSDPAVDQAVRICRKMRSEKIRCDVDDREMTLGKKVSLSRREWIPFEAVLGRREIQRQTISVTSRSDGRRRELDAGELACLIRKECRGMPEKDLFPGERLSRRPIFRG